eukprot:3731355-Rhodomonas_salina.1
MVASPPSHHCPSNSFRAPHPVGLPDLEGKELFHLLSRRECRLHPVGRPGDSRNPAHDPPD